MKREALRYFVCPECHADLRERTPTNAPTIDAGELLCSGCAKSYPIRDGVPRFVASEGYSDTFGRQWNRWDKTQHDSLNGTGIYRNRMRQYTGWSPESFAGKLVIEAGCGSGAYLDVVERHAATVIGFDLSSAIDAAHRLHGARDNVHLAQADIFRPPLRRSLADRLYTFGVVQHTPDPERAFRSLISLVKPGGEVAVWVYRKTLIPQPTYWLRPFTRGMQEPRASEFIEWYVPRALKVSGALARVPAVGALLRRLIPVADYRDRLPDLDAEQQLEWAHMDTHDGLITRYTYPQRWRDLKRWTRDLADVRRPDRGQMSAVGRRPESVAC